VFLRIFFTLLCLVCTTHSYADKKEQEAAAIAKLPSGVTFEIRGQHLGKNVISYMHAKWIAYTNKIPVLFKPFPHSNQMEMHTHEKKLNDSTEWPKMILVNEETVVSFGDPTKTLYFVPYFEEVDLEYQKQPKGAYFPVNWEDKEFKSQIKQMLTPTSGYTAIQLPKGRITVAVHVRQGIPGETPEEIAANPLKFPNEEYYINQIRRLNDIFKGRPMYIHIFTDQKNPVQITKRIQERLNMHHIIFECRREGNNHKANAVDDLFNMSQFQCLIRPESDFSLAAELIGNFAIVIKPVHHRFVKRKNKEMVDQVHVKVRNL